MTKKEEAIKQVNDLLQQLYESVKSIILCKILYNVLPVSH